MITHGSQLATSVSQEQATDDECEQPANVAPPLVGLHSPQQPQHAVSEQNPAEEQFEQRPQVPTPEGDRVGDPFLHGLASQLLQNTSHRVLQSGTHQ